MVIQIPHVLETLHHTIGRGPLAEHPMLISGTVQIRIKVEQQQIMIHMILCFHRVGEWLPLLTITQWVQRLAKMAELMTLEYHMAILVQEVQLVT